MGKHTQGPWEADMFPDTQGYKIRACGRVIAIVKTGDSSPAMEPQMNRHLIGVAPLLFDALEALLELHIAHHNHPEHAAARAAIAKARGEA